MSAPAPRRSGRRPGPSSTREDVLRAARRRFAEQGYDRATFRNIAADAGVDPALVVQFFGTKQDLFVAATRPSVSLAELAEESGAGEPADPALGLARLLVHWLGKEEDRYAMLARIRSAASEPAAAEMVREMIHEQVAGFTPLIAGDRPDARAAMVALQFLGLVWIRWVVPIDPIASMSDDELAEWLGRGLRAFLA
ncbi:MAG TPA: TetR family transcriptional regulator [Thermoleophilaceae bacterium]|jgi:AcrR family transcriptional regulator